MPIKKAPGVSNTSFDFARGKFQVSRFLNDEKAKDVLNVVKVLDGAYRHEYERSVPTERTKRLAPKRWEVYFGSTYHQSREKKHTAV